MKKGKLFPWEIDEETYFAEIEKQKDREVKQKLKSRTANDNGLEMEKAIKIAAERYLADGRLKVIKTPEPFRVIKKGNAGKAIIRFEGHAEPDFIGTLAGGRCIVFESKYTTTDKIAFSVLTDHQAKSLAEHHEMGALAGVCVGMRDRYYFVPWGIFGNMKVLFGRQYVREEDIRRYEVYYTGNSIKFLDYKKRR